MKDFFIKIRHSREASSKSSESPPWASICTELERRLGFGKGQDQVLWASPPPLLETQTPLSPDREDLSPVGCRLASYPLLAS